jgi:hypothetical protein
LQTQSSLVVAALDHLLASPMALMLWKMAQCLVARVQEATTHELADLVLGMPVKMSQVLMKQKLLLLLSHSLTSLRRVVPPRHSPCRQSLALPWKVEPQRMEALLAQLLSYLSAVPRMEAGPGSPL